MRKRLLNIYRLGIKELRSLWHDKIMLILIAYAFSVGIYVGATSTSMELHHVPVAIVDEDRSMLSKRIEDAFLPPYFSRPVPIAHTQIDAGLDAGIYTFVITIPHGFEKEVIAGRRPAMQLNIDATRLSQAGIGAGYIRQMVSDEVGDFLSGSGTGDLPATIEVRMKYNPNLESSWFGGMMEIINNISLLSIILAGAALIREREHGTLEHLLVMPLSPLEIMLSKIWPTALVILVSATFALHVVLEGVLEVPVAGSTALFLFGAFLVLFSTTSMGIFMGTIARSMPQLGLIFILTILPLQVLSGSVTPFESMPEAVQRIMYFTPTAHFVSMAQAVLYRGAGIEVVWPQLLAISAIGLAFFALALLIFRRSLSSAA